MGEESVNLERQSEDVVMDTPERKQITPPVSKFEDSPVFSYLNSLSPIAMIKSAHITQTINSLNFSSPPSVFASPHVSSLKDSRLLRRHQLSDPSNPDFSSSHGDKVDKSEEGTNIVNNIEQQDFVRGIAGEASVEPLNETSVATELPQTLSYECVSPDGDKTSHHDFETNCVPELAGTSTQLVPYSQIVSGNELIRREVHLEEGGHINVNKETAGCDWENLFSDEGDLILFDTPNDSKSLIDPGQGSLDPGMNFCTSLTDNLQKSGVVNAVCSDNNSSHLECIHDMGEVVKDHDILVSHSKPVSDNMGEKADGEIGSLQRGMRRRCLVFEMVGSRRKRLDDGSSSSSSSMLQSRIHNASSDQCVVPLKPGINSSKRRLPGIGLHLNTLSATSVDHNAMARDVSVPGGYPMSGSGSDAYINLSSSQQISNIDLVVNSLDKDLCTVEDGTPTTEDDAQGLGYMENEVSNHSSPKRKRRRSDSDGETEACKRCNCKKSKCLKLYCECFAAGVYCVEPCSCQECFNKPIYEDTVLATRKQIESRNPLAFAPKVIRNSDSKIDIREESSKTPASARHKRGCNCKKSGCLKKYCECYQGGVGCSINCRCEGCKNAFGKKDGSTSTGASAELEEEVELEKSLVNRRLITLVQNDVEQNTNLALPATPLQFGSQSIQPFSSNSKKPPRSLSLSIRGSSSGIYGTPTFGKLNPLQPPAKIQNDQKDEMPEILQRNASPNSVVKSASPNSKRVSPPHCNVGRSPGQRSSRKLILQSIPSFPSLTPKH